MRAFLFPGQGSQAAGMGAPWTGEPSWSRVEEASDATGRDVASLLCDADADTLTETRNAQLATFVVSMVALDAVRQRGLDADAVAGHSLGEYSALCAAGALDFADAARVVAERGEAMQVAATERPGTMAAVLGLDDADVEAACEKAGGEVWVANLNATGQVVIAGDADAIDRAAAAAKELGARRTMPVQVSGAFHTPFMAPAGDRLAAALLDETTFHSPAVPVVANVDAEPHPTAQEWPELLERQLTSPVRWSATLERLAADGVDAFVEIGPGAVLTGTVKRTVRDADKTHVSTPDDLDDLDDLES